MFFNVNNFFTEEAFDSNGLLIDKTKTYTSKDAVIGARNSSSCPLPIFNIDYYVGNVAPGLYKILGYINSSVSNGDVCSGGSCLIPIYGDNSPKIIGTTGLYTDAYGNKPLADGTYGFNSSFSTYPDSSFVLQNGIITLSNNVNCIISNGTGNVRFFIINDLSTINSANPALFSVSANWIWDNIGAQPANAPIVSPYPAVTANGNSQLDLYRIGMKLSGMLNDVSPTVQTIAITVPPGEKVQIYMKRGDGSVNGAWYLLNEYDDTKSGDKLIDLRGNDKLIIQAVSINYNNGPVLTF